MSKNRTQVTQISNFSSDSFERVVRAYFSDIVSATFSLAAGGVSEKDLSDENVALKAN